MFNTFLLNGNRFFFFVKIKKNPGKILHYDKDYLYFKNIKNN